MTVVGRTALACAAASVAVLLSACAAPQNHYVSQQPGAAAAGKVFFTVPYAWTAFPAAAITTAESGWAEQDAAAQSLLGATAWQEAFDASPEPSLEHVLGSGVPESPTVYASLRSLYDAEKDAASTEALRDMVVPVSKLGDQVTVRTDETITRDGLDGVHLVLSVRPGDGRPEQTIDQTAFLSDGKDAVYLLVVRCTTACYDAHADEIRGVTSSYTIQGDRSG